MDDLETLPIHEEHTYGFALVVRSTNPRPHQLQPIIQQAVEFQIGADFELVLVSVDGGPPAEFGL